MRYVLMSCWRIFLVFLRTIRYLELNLHPCATSLFRVYVPPGKHLVDNHRRVVFVFACCAGPEPEPPWSLSGFASLVLPLPVHLRAGTTGTVRGRATAGSTSTHAICRPATVAATHLRNWDEIFWGETPADREAALQCQGHGTVTSQSYLTADIINVTVV